jgi:hypothetical protein
MEGGVQEYDLAKFNYHTILRPRHVSNLNQKFMVFNATFNNISAISWQTVLLVEETGAPGENH